MHRIGGRQGSLGSGLGGAVGGIPPLPCWVSNRDWEAQRGTVLGGQFHWGGGLLKGNGGVQRSPQRGWKSREECKGIRWLDCEADEPSRGESRA